MLRPRHEVRVLEGQPFARPASLHQGSLVITILDYGAGNLRSVANTLAAVGAEFEVVQDASSLERAQKVILPGVGHFGQMMRSLEKMGVREALLSRIDAGIPFL